MGQLKSVFRRGLCAPLNDQRKFSGESTYDETTVTTPGEYAPLRNTTYSPMVQHKAPPSLMKMKQKTSLSKKDTLKETVKKSLSRTPSGGGATGGAAEPKKKGKAYIDLTGGSAAKAATAHNHLAVTRPQRHSNFLYRFSRRRR